MGAKWLFQLRSAPGQQVKPAACEGRARRASLNFPRVLAAESEGLALGGWLVAFALRGDGAAARRALMSACGWQTSTLHLFERFQALGAEKVSKWKTLTLSSVARAWRAFSPFMSRRCPSLAARSSA